MIKMIKIIKMGNIVRMNRMDNTEKPLIMLIIDDDKFKHKHIDKYSNLILNNKEIRLDYSILKTNIINPDSFNILSIDEGTHINKYSSIEPVNHIIRRVVDNTIIFTDSSIFIIDDISYYRDINLKKLGI